LLTVNTKNIFAILSSRVLFQVTWN